MGGVVALEAVRPRRRLLWWILGALALFLILAGGLLLMPKGRPYALLAEFEEVGLTMPRHERLEIEKRGYRVAAYRAQASFEDVVRRADAELKPMGYQRDTDVAPPGVALFVRGSFLMPPSATGGSSTFPEITLILKDTRARAGMSAEDIFTTMFGRGTIGKDPKWVTVAVLGRHEPSLWDRIKQGIGL